MSPYGDALDSFQLTFRDINATDDTKVAIEQNYEKLTPIPQLTGLLKNAGTEGVMQVLKPAVMAVLLISLVLNLLANEAQGIFSYMISFINGM